jgi:alkylated DNA repair dioxygenase AlkB
VSGFLVSALQLSGGNGMALRWLLAPLAPGDSPHNKATVPAGCAMTSTLKPPQERSAAQAELFAPSAPLPALPEGMVYQRDFLTSEEEEELIDVIAAMPVKEMNYRGYTARRRVLSFGGSYDFQAHQLNAAPALPDSLKPLRRKVAHWLGIAPEAFSHVMVAEYREGTPLGWHRDVPDFEDVVGVSLLNEAVMRFRPYPPREPRKAGVIKLVVEPRSVYLLRGPARWGWQHSVAPTKSLRYSITFRTSRKEPEIRTPGREGREDDAKDAKGHPEI